MSVPQGSTAANIQHVSTQRRRKSMTKIKPSTIAIYASVFAIIVVMISIGYREPQNSSSVANATNVSSSSQTNQTSVDNIVATGVAADVAQVTNLPIANNVANLAVSAQISSELVQSDSVSATKPQIIASSAVNRSVISYVIKDSDTVDSIAAQFSISKQTIKWSNGLTSDVLYVGKVLKILPIDGVLYTVKDGDTIDSIAAKYNVDKTRLVLYNDLDVSGPVPNTEIILPSATLPTNEQPGYVAPVAVAYWGGGNGYSFGNCTYYAYSRRIQLGLPVSTSWGNANTWMIGAENTPGFVVSQRPSIGAVAQWDSFRGGAGWAGHVGVVESVNPDGSITISEMNNYAYGGFDIVDRRAIYPGESNWPSNFIN
jgi:surface antigen